MGTGGGDELEAELAVVCGRLNQLSARLVGLVAAALESEAWAGAGIRSPEHWLVLRAGLSPGRARQVVVMARRVRDLPVVMGAFEAGSLSVDQVAVVARHAPSHVEASVAELAVSASVPQLGRVLSRYAFDPPTGADPDPDADPGPTRTAGGAATLGEAEAGARVEPALDEVGRAGAPAELSMGTREGRFELRFSAPADVGALVEAAVSEARDALFAAGTPEVTWAGALVEVCGRSLGSVSSVSRRDSFRVYVHLDAEGGWLNGRPRLPRASGGEADLRGERAAVVGAGRGAGQCGAGVADRAGAHAAVGAGPGPGLPVPRLRRHGAPGGPSRGALGSRWPDGPGQPGGAVPVPPRCASRGGVRHPR